MNQHRSRAAAPPNTITYRCAPDISRAERRAMTQFHLQAQEEDIQGTGVKQLSAVTGRADVGAGEG